MAAHICFPTRLLNIEVLERLSDSYNCDLDLDELQEQYDEGHIDSLIKAATEILTDHTDDVWEDQGLFHASDDEVYDDERMTYIEGILESHDIPYDSSTGTGLSEFRWRPNQSSWVTVHPEVDGAIVKAKTIINILDSTISDDINVLRETLLRNLEQQASPVTELMCYVNENTSEIEKLGLNYIRLLA